MTPRMPPPTPSQRRITIALAVACGLYVADVARAEDGVAPEAAEATETATPEFIEPANIDWSILNTDPTSVYESPSAIDRKVRAAMDDPWSWSRNDKPDGSSAVTIKQPIMPFWDTRVGADLNVTTQTPMPMTSSEILTQKIVHDNQLSQSSGSAWAAMTAPGLGSIWDKTAIEARTDPAQDQSKLATSLTKSLPFGGERYSLTLQNGYNVTQQTLVPVFGLSASSRIYEVDQSARLGIVETGTSFMAGQTHSTADDKWLRRIGAEQKLFGGVTVTGSVSETPEGFANRSLSAGFKTRW
ncbi:MAG: hypothetical protein Q7V17_19500 [Afipia sp.]|nr:hypothetical protein [Afipia sp.]